NDRDFSLLVAVGSDNALPEGGCEPLLIVDPVGEAGGEKVCDLLRGLSPPAWIAERDHVVDRPGIVSDDIGQHEPVYALGMLDGHDERHAAARVMADEARTL